jgi:UDP-glucose 4-epimerase
MKVLVTGAAGGLGSAAFRQLVSEGHEVRATDQTRRLDVPGKIRVGNVLDREFCYDLVDDMDVIVHFANHTHARSANAQRVFNENVSINMNIFQAASESGVRKVIFASSIQAMAGTRSGNDTTPAGVPYLPIDGETPQNPGNPYALSKCVGEMQLQYFVKQKKIQSATAIRFPLLMSREWLAEFRARAERNAEAAFHRSLLDEAFSWLSYEDGGRLIAAIVKSDLPGYRCYLPAHPKPRVKLSIPEIVQRVFPGVPLKKPVDQLESLVDNSRITAETGWTPADDLWTM